MPTEKDIRNELQQVVESGRFVASARLPQFLRHIVEAALAGQIERLKGPLLATEVFQRGKEFDPRLDPIVRVEARRLRARLEEYYAGEGADHAIRIEIPRGSYVPVFLEVDPRPGQGFRSSTKEPGAAATVGELPTGTEALRASQSGAVAPATNAHGVTVKCSREWLYLAALSLFAIGSVWLWSRKR